MEEKDGRFAITMTRKENVRFLAGMNFGGLDGGSIQIPNRSE
jgi:hypothetical protein